MKCHYNSLADFRAKFYNGLLTYYNVKEEISIEDVAYWYLEENRVKYLLGQDAISNLPIKVEQSDLHEKHYRGKVFYFINQYKSMKFKPEKKMSFKELVDCIAPFDHSNPVDFTLLKIIALASYINRINCRIASGSEFGKDSVFTIIQMLRNDVSVYNPSTRASIEARLYNKLLVLNELTNIKGEQKTLVEEMLLELGGFKPVYEKGSRASTVHNTRETYDVTELSLIILYNVLQYYDSQGSGKKYFDKIFQKAVLYRYLPFKFNGKLSLGQFDKNENIECTTDEYNHYVDMVHTIEYFKTNPPPEKTLFNDMNLTFKSDRHARSFKIICMYISAYTDGDTGLEEYLIKELYKRSLDYYEMMGEKKNKTSIEKNVKKGENNGKQKTNGGHHQEIFDFM